ncbi:DUF6124 family protein [Pseudomonas brassicacearum]|uniref:DUF6124 family protein n=1 Tax=Pseudomonas brassicacearum TaxID=930166 RepID=UPI000F4A0793
MVTCAECYAGNWRGEGACPPQGCEAVPLVFDLEGSRRHAAMGIQQVIDLGELLANRVAGSVDQR